MVRNNVLIKLAGVTVAALLHAAFLYGLAAAQPSPYSYAEKYASAQHRNAPQRADATASCALA